MKAATGATRTVPIVGITDDMVGEGYVGSLARPGGNVTGISTLGTELDGKRQEILSEALPRVRKVAVPADLPIEQPTGFRLAVNLGTAREFAIELPNQLVQRADEVIE